MTDIYFELKDEQLVLVIKKSTTDKEYKMLTLVDNIESIVSPLLTSFKLSQFHPLFYKLIHHCQKHLSIDMNLPDVILPDFQIQLLPHQQYGLKFIIKHHRMILGDEMGLGKTATALASLIHYKGLNNLIVCPKSLRINWKREFMKFIPNFEPIIIDKTKKAEKQLQDLDFSKPNFIIIPYSLLNNLLPILKKFNLLKWDFIVADESHFLKHASSQRSKAFKLISKNCKLLQLSATVAHKTCDLYNLLKLCNNEIFAEFHTPFAPKTIHIPKPSIKHFYYAERYITIRTIRIAGGRLIYDYKTPRRLEELHALTQPFILRRLLNDVVSLPPLIEETIIIGELSKNLEKKFKDDMKRMELIKESKSKQAADVILMELVRTTSKLKQPIVLEYLLDLSESYHEKVLVFFYHKEFGDFLQEGLTKANIKNVKVHSDIKPDDRQDLFDQFTDGDIQFGLFSLGTASTGLNFTCANLCIYADMNFDVDTIEQSRGRCKRLGQTKKVILQFLQLDYSTDEILIKSIKAQQRTSHIILDS